MKKTIIASAILLCTSAFAEDHFDPTTNILNIPEVRLGTLLYSNVKVRLVNYEVLSVESARDVGVIAPICAPSNFSVATYNAIKPGMTFDEVRKLIGCEITPSRTSRASIYTRFIWEVPYPGQQEIWVEFDPATSSKVYDYGNLGSYKNAFGF